MLCAALETVLQWTPQYKVQRLQSEPLCVQEIGQGTTLKWSGKFGQRAKVYPTRTNGYENDKATELFRQFQSYCGA